MKLNQVSCPTGGNLLLGLDVDRDTMGESAGLRTILLLVRLVRDDKSGIVPLLFCFFSRVSCIYHCRLTRLSLNSVTHPFVKDDHPVLYQYLSQTLSF